MINYKFFWQEKITSKYKFKKYHRVLSRLTLMLSRLGMEREPSYFYLPLGLRDLPCRQVEVNRLGG